MKTVELGYFRDEYGSVIFATAEVRLERHEQSATTIDHQHIDTHDRLSITGTERAVTNGRRVGNGIGWGRIDTGLRKMTYCDRFGERIPMPAKTRKLLAIWDEWHLNDLRAACCHQERHQPTADELAIWWEPQAKEANRLYRDPYIYSGRAQAEIAIRDVFGAIQEAKCPEGYKWGHAWLVAPLPSSVLDWYASL